MIWKDQKWTLSMTRDIPCYKINLISIKRRKLSDGVSGPIKTLAFKVPVNCIILILGLVYVKESSAYTSLIEPFLKKKKSLALDAWGASDTHLSPLFSQLEDFFRSNIPEGDQKRYPWPVWKFEQWISRVVRNELLSEFLVPEWARYFGGLSLEELEDLGKSFALENCVLRKELNRVLKADSDI